MHRVIWVLQIFWLIAQFVKSHIDVHVDIIFNGEIGLIPHHYHPVHNVLIFIIISGRSLQEVVKNEAVPF